MRRTLFTLTLLSSALALPLAAHADTIDDFVITGGSNTFSFSLPASPPGNESTCPPTSPSCLPGSETAFYLSAPVVFNGISIQQSLSFPTIRFGGGLSIGDIRFFGSQLFAPDAANPTFLTGSFILGATVPDDPSISEYFLTIAPETSNPAVPEPSTIALFSTGTCGLLSLLRRRRINSF